MDMDMDIVSSCILLIVGGECINNNNDHGTVCSTAQRCTVLHVVRRSVPRCGTCRHGRNAAENVP